MDEFKTWFFIGFEHIMDIQALDHTLFILALVVAYDSSQLKKLFSWLQLSLLVIR